MLGLGKYQVTCNCQWYSSHGHKFLFREIVTLNRLPSVNVGNLDDKNCRLAHDMLPAKIAYVAPPQAAGKSEESIIINRSAATDKGDC